MQNLYTKSFVLVQSLCSPPCPVCVCVCVYLVWDAVQQVVQRAELPEDGLWGGRGGHGLKARMGQQLNKPG